MGCTKLYGSEHPLASDLTQYHIPLQLPQYTLPFGSLCHKQNVPFSQPVFWNFAYLYGSAPCTPSWAGSRGDQIPITDVPCSFSFMGNLSLDTYLLFSKMHFLGILKLESLLACVNDVNTLLLPQTIYGPCWPSNLVFYYVTTSPHTTWGDWGQVGTWLKNHQYTGTWLKNHQYIGWPTSCTVEWHEILCLNWGRSLLTKDWTLQKV